MKFKWEVISVEEIDNAAGVLFGNVITKRAKVINGWLVRVEHYVYDQESYTNQNLMHFTSNLQFIEDEYSDATAPDYDRIKWVIESDIK